MNITGSKPPASSLVAEAAVAHELIALFRAIGDVSFVIASWLYLATCSFL
jgi:hypothetical protein